MCFQLNKEDYLHDPFFLLRSYKIKMWLPENARAFKQNTI